MTTATPLMLASGIVKRFGPLVANDCVNVAIGPGEVHALLGENGAGKSTLVKILYGLLQPDAGSLAWEGRTISLKSPAEARRLGVGMVFQHFSLFEALTVAENVALALDGTEPVSAVADRLVAVSEAYGLPLDPRREVWRLSVGERQRIEIVRCLMQHPRLLILDEPTSVLTPQETEGLFATLARIKAEGCAILYISHKLEEVRRICDRATILRHGKVVATCDPRQQSAASLAQMMVGSKVMPTRHEPVLSDQAPFLRVQDLSLRSPDPHGTHLSGIDLAVRPGEITGIAGVAGNGQDELFAALSGEILAARPEVIILAGQPVGNGFVRSGLVDKPGTLGWVDRVVAAFDVRKGPRDPAASALSGGNLQKFVVGRDILRNPRLLIVSQPTWGVDAGAAALIRQALVDLARSGAAVLVISQDLDELFEIADRMAVIFHGRLSPALPTAGLAREAAIEALADAGLTMADIDSVVVASGPAMFGAVNQPEKWLVDALGARYKPLVRITSGGGTGLAGALAA
ncbi:MAG: ATP-binding cassette domain-containing protein, partial [Hyphomicrobiales bacterium]|nr:ATP-binding cassette domain-containing protein [Hyphomicrobiales bacterium]